MIKPVKVILDTDIGPDCDDAAALSILHALADRGEAEIVGVTHCTSSPWGAGCIDAINRYHGRPDIPVGTLKETGFLDEDIYRKYNRHLAENYPNRFEGGMDAPDAADLFRELLAQEADHSVVMIAIGPLRNLLHLLQSGPDRHSSLDGIELVGRKVERLVVMGGAFPSGKEWNFEMCPASAQFVAEHWPTSIMFSGFEIGRDILTGGPLFTHAPADSPVRDAYERYLGEPGSRNSWDLTAVLYGVRGLRDYWEAVTGGSVQVAADGETIWHDTADKGHSYLVQRMDPETMRELLDELLVSRYGDGDLQRWQK
ncbi:nucleoside hydrolase [Paenibacillus spongiae]|uniref:Nucleoside hydrolase n=1 Tax=Paenibacillus spongiae TaxID=2909671 RepID=A0ABY5S859_9BACL|nr:nucleoside hydrolase [Paenibacillus spongiae]UVI28893.1 nucleoside hydrolase [Paenibacillus spongiae]